jgi:hypothetical protein
MTEIKAADLQAPPSIAALQNKALGIGIVGMAASIAGYLADPRAATESYLLAFIYWIAFPLGSLGLMMVHHLSGGGWGMPVRRIFEASARTRSTNGRGPKPSRSTRCCNTRRRI